MESFSKFKCHLVMALFFFISFATCNAQQIHKYNDSNSIDSQSKMADLDKKINSLLNSKDVLFFKNQQSASKFEILDIDYIDLSSINQVSKNKLFSVKYCIVRIAESTTIDLNYLNQLSNLELVHLIIETDTASMNIPSIITMSNPNIVISYQISIPQ